MIGIEPRIDEVRDADPGELSRDKPDAHWRLSGSAGAAGRCSAWWRATPALGSHRVGMIGHYSSNALASGALLEHACRSLAEAGCTLAVGPIDGSTSRQYRLITQHGDEPSFFLEPDNPPEWIDHFVRSGFEPLARYFSAMNEDLRTTDPRVERHSERLSAGGVTVRAVRRGSFTEDLRSILNVARIAFCGNLLYSNPEEDEFLGLWRPLLSRVPPELVLLAEHTGRAVGFVFALPDLNEPARGAPPRTVIVKTLAALPERRYAGLGQWLLEEVHARAHALGFSRAIHALVREAGHLERISGRYARPFRRYTLFARALSK